MTLTVLRNADVLVCMDDARREIPDGAVAFRDGVIVAVGTTTDLAAYGRAADTIIEARGCVVTPGLVNTHHHLYQSLTRALPGAINASLFHWLQRLYPIWGQYRPEDVFAATQLGLAELAMSGCSLSSDHLYLFPNGVTLDDTIAAAAGIGIRFHPTRGSMSVGESAGGLPPDTLVEDEAAILSDTIRVIDRFHDAEDGAMVRVGVAPCSPFSVSRELMRDSALLARDKGVMLHTHLAENAEDVAFSLERFGCRPGEYAESLGWTGPDVWHAHCVQLDRAEIALFARTRTGVAHCPCSNCRLGSGIAPLKAMFTQGVPLGLGVDGSASSDSGHLLQEARQAMLLQRAIGGPGAFDPRDVLYLATRGGAEMLGRTDCGSLTVGKRADLAVWDVTDVASTGAWDPVAGLILAPPAGVRDLFVEGREVVRDGHLARIDRRDVLRAAQASLARLKDFALMTPEQARDPDYFPGLATAIPLGIQHVLAMFVSNMTPAIIVAGAAGFGYGSKDPAEMIYLIQMSMLFAGIATLIQTVGIGPAGARLPLVQGTSFAFLPIMIPIVAGHGPAAMGALTTAAICGGLFHTVLSFFVGRIRFALPPMVTGLVVLMIGVSLMRIGVQYAAGGVPAQGTVAYGAGSSWLLAGVVVMVTLALSFYGRGIWQTAAVLLGLVAGYMVALALGKVSLTPVGTAGWFMLPSPFHFGFALSLSAIAGFVLMGFISAIESIGAVSAICEGTAGRPATDRELIGATCADGVGTALAGVFGAMPNTSFSQNVGLIAITGVMSRHVVTIGAAFLILCGLAPKVGAAIVTIPIEVLGGGVIVMFGMVASAALSILSDVAWTQRNMLIFGVALSVAVGLELEPATVGHLPETLRILATSGVLPAAVIAVVLNLIVPETVGRAVAP